MLRISRPTLGYPHGAQVMTGPSREIKDDMLFSFEVVQHAPFSSIIPMIVSSVVLIFIVFSLRSRPRYPPGPRSHPFIGHTLQVPVEKAWLYFERLGKKYGSVIRLSLAGDEIVVLNNVKDAEELLNRRSHNYSSRKPIIYAGKYQSQNKRMLILPYGKELRKHRAVYSHMLQSKVISSYDSLQEQRSCDLLVRMCTHPQDLELNMKRYAASIIYTIAYGKDLEDDEDLHSVIDILNNFVQHCLPGAHLVDTFPILDLLPDFLAPWRNDARMKHEKDMEVYGRLLLEVKDKIDHGSGDPSCLAARVWEDNTNVKLDLVSLSYVTGTAFEAGTDTTAITLLWFIVAMLAYPESLKRAQDEIDGVLGIDGSFMPGYEHMNDLPYCFALTKEVFRWRPALPGGFPHYSDKEDNYKGYIVKANTMVIPNIWAMHQDEELYPNPSSFDPYRFYKDGEIDTNPALLSEDHYVFGFGRRICPGKYLASKSVWIGIVRVLWAFNIAPGLDAAGKPIPIDTSSCTPGLTSKPTPFPFRISLRSHKHGETIRREHEVISRPLSG